MTLKLQTLTFLFMALCTSLVAAPSSACEHVVVDVAKEKLCLKPGELFRDCPKCPDMVVIPPGTFQMGSTKEKREGPIHEVTIARPFAMGRFKVTWPLWDACVAAGDCKVPAFDIRQVERYKWYAGDKMPALNLSWDQAKALVAWFSKTTNRKYRLPSEAEWEYAARAGTKTRWWWGDRLGSSNANCSDCREGLKEGPTAVGTFKPNPFGHHDTAGNVIEWTEDCRHKLHRSTDRRFRLDPPKMFLPGVSRWRLAKFW